MRYKAILDDLKCKIFFVPQPWWGAFKRKMLIISIPEAPSIYSHRALTLLTPG